uniref:Uncharacterized protein n=1 Tax=Ditylenchus dipsaci TaxID=166011 RepID=A0A915DF75_9BILA
MERFGIDRVMSHESEPLFVDKGQVKLVDPNDNEPCTAKWILNKDETDYIRDYIEVEGKDTKADDALKVTYKPKLCTFEQELEEAYGIKDNRKPKPTFWY